jgi:heptosyltransferase-3
LFDEVGIHARAIGRRARGRSRKLLGRSLAWLLRTPATAGRLEPGSIRRVLICRTNRRMGNTLFLTPLIDAIAEQFPGATVDLLVAYAPAPELLRGLPGVNRVFVMPDKGPSRLRRRIRMMRNLREQSYDLVIDPVLRSTSGRIVLSLAKAPLRLGFAGEDQWAPLTHAVPVEKGRLHDAESPVYLLMSALGRDFEPGTTKLRVALDDSELRAGEQAVRRCIGAGPAVDVPQKVFGFFVDATGRKKLDRSWWKAFITELKKLNPAAAFVEILPSKDTAPLEADIPALHFSSLRDLAAAMSAMSCFISADAGPMHLASAVVPTVALFNVTDPRQYRPLKPEDLVIDVDQTRPEAAAAMVSNRQIDGPAIE